MQSFTSNFKAQLLLCSIRNFYEFRNQEASRNIGFMQCIRMYRFIREWQPNENSDQKVKSLQWARKLAFQISRGCSKGTTSTYYNTYTKVSAGCKPDFVAIRKTFDNLFGHGNLFDGHTFWGGLLCLYLKQILPNSWKSQLCNDIVGNQLFCTHFCLISCMILVVLIDKSKKY